MASNSYGMFKRNGVPIAIGDDYSSGKVLWASSDGLAGNSGKDPEHPISTIDGAINKFETADANSGCRIFVMEGHAETLSAATSLVPDVAGLQIIGLGHGADAPDLTFSATTSTITVGAANVRLKNLNFIAGVSAVSVGVTCHDYTIIEDCRFDFSTTAYDFVRMIDIDAHDYAQILNNRFIAENATAGSNEAIRLDDCHHVVIDGNYISGDFARAAIIGEGGLGKSLKITNNYIFNDDTGAASNGIDLNVAFTGIIDGNYIFSLYATACAAVIDPGSCGMGVNYISNKVDQYAISTAVGAAST